MPVLALEGRPGVDLGLERVNSTVSPVTTTICANSEFSEGDLNTPLSLCNPLLLLSTESWQQMVRTVFCVDGVTFALRPKDLLCSPFSS